MSPTAGAQDQTVGRIDVLPRAFACSSTNDGLEAAWVYATGELDIATAQQLGRSLDEALSRSRLVVLDLRELAFIDSTGVHAIVEASVRAQEDGRRLIIMQGQPNVDRMFALTGTAGDVAIIKLNPAALAAGEMLALDLDWAA